MNSIQIAKSTKKRTKQTTLKKTVTPQHTMKTIKISMIQKKSNYQPSQSKQQVTHKKVIKVTQISIWQISIRRKNQQEPNQKSKIIKKMISISFNSLLHPTHQSSNKKMRRLSRKILFKFRKRKWKTVTEIRNSKKKIMNKILKLLKLRNNLLSPSRLKKTQKDILKPLLHFPNLLRNKKEWHKALRRETKQLQRETLEQASDHNQHQEPLNPKTSLNKRRKTLQTNM